MSRAEKYFPFIFASLIPIFSVINHSIDLTGVESSTLLFRNFQASFHLLILWYLNKWLLYTDTRLKRAIGTEPTIIVGNLMTIVILGFINKIVVPAEIKDFAPKGLQLIRLVSGILVVNVTLRIFKSQKERSALKVQNLSLQAENLKFQIDMLKQQINPHFLFNSFNTLLDLIEEDPKAAAKYTRSFSKLYRVVLQSAKLDFIPIRDELEFMHDYWNLLKMRFHEAIELVIDIEETKMDGLIPPLSLQFLLENAVKHNEASKKAPLVIEISAIENHLIVKNKLNPKAYPTDSEKIGLVNLQQRFTVLLQPIEYGIKDDHFVVQIPFKTL